MAASHILVPSHKRPHLDIPPARPVHLTSFARGPSLPRVLPFALPSLPSPIPILLPSMTNPSCSNQRLGKNILCDCELFDALGWEKLVRLRRGRGDLTDMTMINHPAKSLLQNISASGPLPALTPLFSVVLIKAVTNFTTSWRTNLLTLSKRPSGSSSPTQRRGISLASTLARLASFPNVDGDPT
jgi:hypothetical protein